jgi:hypothetical protein
VFKSRDGEHVAAGRADYCALVLWMYSYLAGGSLQSSIFADCVINVSKVAQLYRLWSKKGNE